MQGLLFLVNAVYHEEVTMTENTILGTALLQIACQQPGPVTFTATFEHPERRGLIKRAYEDCAHGDPLLMQACEHLYREWLDTQSPLVARAHVHEHENRTMYGESNLFYAIAASALCAKSVGEVATEDNLTVALTYWALCEEGSQNRTLIAQHMPQIADRTLDMRPVRYDTTRIPPELAEWQRTHNLEVFKRRCDTATKEELPARSLRKYWASIWPEVWAQDALITQGLLDCWRRVLAEQPLVDVRRILLTAKESWGKRSCYKILMPDLERIVGERNAVLESTLTQRLDVAEDVQTLLALVEEGETDTLNAHGFKGAFGRVLSVATEHDLATVLRLVGHIASHGASGKTYGVRAKQWCLSATTLTSANLLVDTLFDSDHKLIQDIVRPAIERLCCDTPNLLSFDVLKRLARSYGYADKAGALALQELRRRSLPHAKRMRLETLVECWDLVETAGSREPIRAAFETRLEELLPQTSLNVLGRLFKKWHIKPVAASYEQGSRTYLWTRLTQHMDELQLAHIDVGSPDAMFNAITSMYSVAGQGRCNAMFLEMVANELDIVRLCGYVAKTNRYTQRALEDALIARITDVVEQGATGRVLTEEEVRALLILPADAYTDWFLTTCGNAIIHAFPHLSFATLCDISTKYAGRWQWGHVWRRLTSSILRRLLLEVARIQSTEQDEDVAQALWTVYTQLPKGVQQHFLKVVGLTT